MDISIFSDPKVIGPGIWFKMHIDAVGAITDEMKNAFEYNINLTCDNFKCVKCKTHFRHFINTHSFQDYWNIQDSKGNDIGFFQWTWELHNKVNEFLKKDQPLLHDAYIFYSNASSGACFNCGNDNNKSAVNSGMPKSKSTKPKTTKPKSTDIPHILSIYMKTGAVIPKPFGK
jgi:Erv1/Alr family protein